VPPPRDRPAGDVDYEAVGHGYVAHRRTDPRIERVVLAALGEAQTVINVGAGAGSYEPVDRYVLAVEPAAAMRAQRPASRPAIDATAEHLPVDDDSFDAAMAMFTVHQWPDLARGLAELRRVSRGPVIVMTADPDVIPRWWFADYAPELLANEASRCPPLAAIEAALGGRCTVTDLPVPIDCTDGFMEAYYGRPEAFLDPAVRRAQSCWPFLTRAQEDDVVARLRDDLDSGRWDERYGELRQLPEFNGSLRLVVAVPD
jgi:SAM-dependent methyltransferase